MQQADEGGRASLAALYRVLPCYPYGHGSWLAAVIAASVHTFCTCILHAYSPTARLAEQYSEALYRAKEHLDIMMGLTFPDM